MSPQSVIQTLTLSLEPPRKEAQITQDQLGAVNFDGTATVDQPRLLTSMLTLSAVVNTGWPVVISGQTMEITGPGSESFQVTVVVPPSTSSLMVGNVLVTGSLKAPGLEPIIASASAIVTVSQYHIAEINCTDTSERVEAGETATFEVQIFNLGNGQTEFELTVMDLPEGIIVKLSEERFTVAQDGYMEITVRVEVGSDVDSGVNRFILQLNVVGEDAIMYQKDFYVDVPGMSPGLVTTLIITGVIVAVAVPTLFIARRKGWFTGFRRPLKTAFIKKGSTEGSSTEDEIAQ